MHRFCKAEAGGQRKGGRLPRIRHRSAGSLLGVIGTLERDVGGEAGF